MSGSETQAGTLPSGELPGASVAHPSTDDIRPKVGGAALFSIAIVTTMWWALAPRRPMAISISANEAGASRLPSDQLAGLPKSYDAVPQLGPPLPGDLDVRS